MSRTQYLVASLLLGAGLLLLLTTLQVTAQSGADVGAVVLDVQKDVNTGRAAPGDVLTYTITIESAENDSSVIAWLTDTLPAELTYATDSLTATVGSFGVKDRVITWTAEMYGLGYTAHISFSAEISPDFTSGTIVNAAQVTGTGVLREDTAETQIVAGSGEVYLPLIFRNYPPIPVLNPIDNGGGTLSNYTVSWSSVGVPIDGYVLQESTRADFATVSGQWLLATTSRSFDKGTASGTYYYRVRADNDSRWGEGPWSNVESVTIWGYDDDFSDYQSGWPREWSTTRGALYGVRPYEHPACPGDDCRYWGDGYIIARRSGSNPQARFGPGVVVPSAHYEIEVDTRWWEAAYYATYQIFFGSDNSFTDPDDLSGEYYALQVRINVLSSSNAFCEYSLIRRDVSLLADGNPRSSGPTAIESTVFLKNWERSSAINCDTVRGKWNHWRIRRDGSTIEIYVNSTKLGEWNDSTYGANRYFGVGCTLYEGFTPSKPEFDNWSVTLLP